MSDFDHDDSAPGTTPGQEDDAERTMPLSAMGAEDLPHADDGDYQSVRKSSKLFSHGSMLLVLVAVIAAGAIFAMRQTTTVGTGHTVDRAVEAKIEQALAKLSRPHAMSPDDPLAPDNLSTMNQETDAIVALFHDDVTERQVPLEYVQKDPFVLYQPPAEIEVSVGPQGPSLEEIEAQKRAAAIAARERALREELRRMRCDAIMGDLVMINGTALRRGMTIGSFTIVEVRRSSVILRADDFGFRLHMNGDVETLD
ncbi:MAG: hypothetical protein JJU36_17280 [Phycisphaeraceae bacterium]|nr:hypothetical protein [Phycisphaeraceae bacterium]